MRLLSILAAAAAATAQPTSYSRQVAPILAMNCHLCHGANPESAAGGLSTRTWQDLMKGGNMGPVLVAGDPERSPLYQFISGARGEAHRMPLGGPPLAPAEVETIRRWIAEGAHADPDVPTRRLSISAIRMEPSVPLRIRARVSAASYVWIEVAGRRGEVLHLDGGAVREDGGVAALGRPGEWLEWTLRRAPGWPGRVRVTMHIAHPRPGPLRAELTAGGRKASSSH